MFALNQSLACRVGKTTLAKAFVTGSIPEAVKPTVGADLLFKTMHLGKHKAYVQVFACIQAIHVMQARHPHFKLKIVELSSSPI